MRIECRGAMMSLHVGVLCNLFSTTLYIASSFCIIYLFSESYTYPRTGTFESYQGLTADQIRVYLEPRILIAV